MHNLTPHAFTTMQDESVLLKGVRAAEGGRGGGGGAGRRETGRGRS